MKIERKLIIDEIVYPINENKTALIQAASIVCRNLWLFRQLSKEESNHIKWFIHSFITSFANPYTGYIEFCERILLIRDHIKTHPLIILNEDPTTWLNCNFRKSDILFQEFGAVKQLFPLHKNHYKALAECILDLVETPEPDYNYWIHWFISRGMLDELVTLPYLILYTNPQKYSI